MESPAMIAAKDCTTMTEVRAAIDELDRQLVTLLAERLRYIEAAARIKTERTAVRDEWRKADVLAKVVATAEKVDFPADLAGQLWEMLVEYSIAYEFREYDHLKAVS